MNGTILQQNLRFVVNAVMYFLIRQAICSKIKPQGISSFWTPYLYFRHLLLYEVDQEVDVAVQVLVYLIHPLVALIVCSDQSLDGEWVCHAHAISFLEFLAQLWIFDDRVGASKAGQVEALVDCGEDDDVALVLDNRAEWMMGYTFAQQVAVYFIGEDEDIVLLADRSDLLQLFYGPYTADRVCRRAPDQDLVVWICAFFFQIFIVNCIVTVLIDQQVRRNRFSVPIVYDCLGEVTVNWTANDDAIALVGEGIDCNTQCIKGTIREENFIWGDLPIVTYLKPTANSLCIFWASDWHGVTEHLLFYCFMKSIQNRLCSCKVHIRCHHRDCFIACFLAKDAQPDCIPFCTVSSATVNDLIKVIFHFI